MASSEVVQTSESLPRNEPTIRPRPDVRPHLYEALGLLAQAHEYAIELGQDVWELAVELSVLRGAKITNSDLRWLAAKGYIEHAVEATTADDCTRRFRRTTLLSFTEATCIVLTPGGVALARELGSREPVIGIARPQFGIWQMAAPEDIPGRPKWDQQRRQLRMGSEVVKEFKLPSPNQETVLTAFEEEGWPPRVDDPLPPLDQLDPRRRLHDTIKALNRKQKHDLIRFRGDGSGEGIRWEPTLPHVAAPSSALRSG